MAALDTPALAAIPRELKLTGVFRYTDTWPVAAHLAATGHVDLEHVEEALNADRLPGAPKAMVRL